MSVKGRKTPRIGSSDNPIYTLAKWKWLRHLEQTGTQPDAPVASFAEIARQSGLVALQHTTSSNNALAILKSGAIHWKSRRASSFGGGARDRLQAAYLHSVNQNNRTAWLWEAASWTDTVVFEMSLDTLDAVQWHHATAQPASGQETELTSYRDRSFELYCIAAANMNRQTYNEVVFRQNIPVVSGNGLLHIYTSPQNREKILRGLQNIQPPTGRNWEEVVVPLTQDHPLFFDRVNLDFPG